MDYKALQLPFFFEAARNESNIFNMATIAVPAGVCAPVNRCRG